MGLGMWSVSQLHLEVQKGFITELQGCECPKWICHNPIFLFVASRGKSSPKYHTLNSGNTKNITYLRHLAFLSLVSKMKISIVLKIPKFPCLLLHFHYKTKPQMKVKLKPPVQSQIQIHFINFLVCRWHKSKCLREVLSSQWKKMHLFGKIQKCPFKAFDLII